MPEGPEVRRNADALEAALGGKRIVAISARTREARLYLSVHGDVFPGRRMLWVRSHGKNLVGYLEGGFYFYVHLMMWGRWLLEQEAPLERDRRERARLEMQDGTTAILLSAPVFEVGALSPPDADPFQAHPYLQTLGPDILPYPEQGAFAAGCFLERLTAPENRDCEIGGALLDQRIAAGTGNYLRAEVLFVCGIDPFRTVSDLTPRDLSNIAHYLPEIAARAYQEHGVTVSAAARVRIKEDASLRYPNSKSDWSGAYFVFRRTNLPCVICGHKIRQKRQTIFRGEDGEDRGRIIYFCPVCQGVRS